LLLLSLRSLLSHFGTLLCQLVFSLSIISHSIGSENKVQMSSTQERRELKGHVVRVAVVGGGVAGASLANRLAELSANTPVAGSVTFEVDLFDQVTSMTYHSFLRHVLLFDFWHLVHYDCSTCVKK
jgi:hypothetical protein